MTRKHIPKPGDAKLRQDGSAQAAPGLIGHCSQGYLARQNALFNEGLWSRVCFWHP